MSRRRELGEFLRARRAATPVPEGSHFPREGRRVPGLRREEVAELALISETYYTRLERGTVLGISAAVLDGLAEALHLSAQERAYVASLIPVTGQDATLGERPAESIAPSLRRLLEALGTAPAHVHNERAEIIAANPAGRALYPWHFENSERPNAIAFLFVHPRARDFFVDWQEWADQGVFFLRSALARDPGNRLLKALVADLRARSREFTEAWQSHRVAFQQFGTREINHPRLGRLSLDFQSLQPIGYERLRVVVYTAEPGSATARRLADLSSG
ncbi:MAG: helix-turn-helix transcriptional regulator [Tetrasphaera sp.]